MKRLMLFIISLCAACICGELLVRWYAPQKVYTTAVLAESCYQSDPTLYTMLKPQSRCKSSSTTNPADVYINTLGFRDTKDKTLQKSLHTKRILFIGDSYTFGHGVEASDSYPFKIEGQLKKQESQVEILNAGIPGVGPDWYYLFLKESATKLSPDLIVVGLYLGNDLTDYAYFDTSKRDENGLPTKIGTSFEYVDADHTRRTSATPWQYTLPFFRTSHLFIAIANRISPPTITEIALSMNGSGCYLKRECTESDSDIKKTAILARSMADIADSYHIPIVFVLLPWEAQLSRNLNMASGGYLLAASKAQRHALSDKVGGALKNQNILYIDLLEAFDAHPSTEAVYTPIDYHWNATGHRIAAEYLAPKLQAILFPPSKTEME